MNRSAKYFIFVVLVIILVLVAFFIYKGVSVSSVSLEEMKYCEYDSDCVPVDCGCSCSGCGGFSYEDIVNEKYQKTWHAQNNCKAAEVCPEVCCPEMKVVCENNRCNVKLL